MTCARRRPCSRRSGRATSRGWRSYWTAIPHSSGPGTPTETGLRAEPVIYLGGYRPDTGRLELVQHIFRVEAFGQVPEFVPEPGVAVEYVRPEAVLALIRAGHFAQLHHIGALLLAGLAPGHRG